MDIVDLFNSIAFERLDGIECGEMLRYEHISHVSKKAKILAIGRIIINLLTSKCDVNIQESGEILFLFSNSYAKRNDFRTWFDEVCQLTKSKVIVVPSKRKICLRKIVYLGTVYKWIRNVKANNISFSDSIYYTSIIARAAADLWDVQRVLKAKKINPKLIVTICDVLCIDTMFVQFYNHIGIDTVSLQHGSFSSITNPTVMSKSKSKYYLIFGEQTKKECLLAGMESEKIKMVGMPQYINISMPKKIVNNRKNVFGVILDGNPFVESDIEMLKIAEAFARKKKMKYYVKLHPGTPSKVYGNALVSANLIKVYSTEKNIAELSTMIDFAMVAKSTVFTEYILNLIPIIAYADEQDIYKEIEWCKVRSIDDMLNLYDMLKNSKEDYERKMLKTREYLCECGDVAENYRRFFANYTDKI